MTLIVVGKDEKFTSHGQNQNVLRRDEFTQIIFLETSFVKI
jgi:hypothetical protein